MTELNIPLLSKLLLLESRTLEFADNKRAQFQYAMVRLSYTHYSLRLIRLMLRLSPWSSAVIILGRFYEGFMPSIKLRIKGEFLDIVQAALEKKPFNRTRLYNLGILQVALYFISSTLTDYIIDANAYIGHAMSHKLQIDLLRAHLRLSIADLQDSQIQGRHQQAKSFTNSSINTLLGPLHLFQDLTSILAQAWTLRTVLKEKGRRARPLIALSCFNSIFRILYDRWETYEHDEEDYAARTSKQDFFYLATDTRARAEISTFGLKDWVLGTYDRLSQHLQQRSSATVNRVRVKGTMRGFVRNLTDAMSYILVATKYTDLTLSSLSLMQSASMDILWNLEALYEACKSLIRDLDSMKNYFDFLDPEMNPSSTPRKEPFADYSEPTGRGMKIVAKDLTFAYPGSEGIKPVLKGLNFTIDKGEFIAIVGGNGSGKSTLMTLLTRLYDPKSGSVEVNDIDLRCYDKDELWSHMSTVSQNFGKYYNLSVGHNIGLGDVYSMDNKEAISKAAETGGALDFISSFPDAFETIMAHHHYQRAGHKKKKVQMGISGGQWQRLALSRAFMRLNSADLLLLDEPSASLDPEAEFKLFKALKEARRGRTTIYISHRFNTVRAANRIMVIEKGELVEFGTHEELMALKGRYSYLYSLQTDALADTPDSDTRGEKKDEESNGEGDKISDGSANTSDDEVQDLIVVNGEKDEIKANRAAEHGDIITNGHVANGHGNGLDSMDSI